MKILPSIFNIIYGFISKQYNIDFLINSINKNKIESYVEVGVWKGKTFFNILKHCKNLKVAYGIDPYNISTYENDLRGGIALRSQNFMDKTYESIIKKSNKYPISEIIKLTSKDASKIFKDETLDYVFIDANHSYKSVKEDIQLWYPKLKKGGILVGHDYSLKFFGVILAVHEIIGIDNIGTNHNIWWTKK